MTALVTQAPVSLKLKINLAQQVVSSGYSGLCTLLLIYEWCIEIYSRVNYMYLVNVDADRMPSRKSNKKDYDGRRSRILLIILRNMFCSSCCTQNCYVSLLDNPLKWLATGFAWFTRPLSGILPSGHKSKTGTSCLICHQGSEY